MEDGSLSFSLNRRNCDTGEPESSSNKNNIVIAPVCGNGILQAGEQCDDGNLFAGDGCNQFCMIEGVYAFV